MVTWREMLLKRDGQGFTDGLNDARCRTVDPIAYQINREYRNGVDIAQQLEPIRKLQQTPVVQAKLRHRVFAASQEHTRRRYDSRGVPDQFSDRYLMATFDVAWNEKLNIPIAGGTIPLFKLS